MQRVLFSRFHRALALGLVLAAGLGASSSATTLMPGDVSGGAFSKASGAPTLVPSGYDGVAGTLVVDYLHPGTYLEFTDVAAGAQSLTLTFALPASVTVQGTGGDWSFANAGGEVHYSTTPFSGDWDGAVAGGYDLTNFFAAPVMSKTVTLDLGSSFAGGPLYLGLLLTYGTADFTIDAPGNAPAAPGPSAVLSAVPLPGSAPLIAGAFALLALAVRRGRRAG